MCVLRVPFYSFAFSLDTTKINNALFTFDLVVSNLVKFWGLLDLNWAAVIDSGHFCDDRCAKVRCSTRHTLMNIISMTVSRKFGMLHQEKLIIVFLKWRLTRRVGTEISPSKSTDTQLAFYQPPLWFYGTNCYSTMLRLWIDAKDLYPD